MKRVKFGDVVVRANTKEDKNNTEKEFYLDGQYFEGQELEVEKGSPLRGATIGPMFYFGFKSGQVLFMSRSFAIKKAAVARFDGICSEKTFVLETKDSNILLQEYLVFILQNQLFWDYCEENKSGSVNFFINWSTLERYEFDLPDIEEQKKVSDSLWAAYEVKKSYRKMISSIDEMVKSQFIGQFGSIVADKELSDIAEIYDGVHQTPHYTDSGVKFISVEDISDIYASKKYISIEDYSKYKHVPDLGDLIMTRIGTIGMCAVVSKSEPLAYYVSVTLIKPDHSVIDSTYLKYYIESDYGQSELRMRSLLEAFPMKINLNEIGKIAIKVPTLDEQRAFVSIVKQADKSKFELKQAIEKIDKAMQALMQ